MGYGWAMDGHKEQGGITGFQSGFVMWGFIQNWEHLENQPLKLVKYADMLYPQHEDKFKKTISRDTWKWLQDEAKKRLEEDSKHMHPSVKLHMISIAEGKVPFGFAVVDD
jgi:hypothetical protein